MAKKKVIKRVATKVKKPVVVKSAPKPAKQVVMPKPSFALSPLGDRLVLEEVKDTVERTSSGIYLPAATQDKETKKGRVVAAGPGRYDDGNLVPMLVKVGDVVLYSWGDKVKVGDVEYTIVRESDVIAVVNE